MIQGEMGIQKVKFRKIPEEEKKPEPGLCPVINYGMIATETIYNPVVYFKNTYTDDWITDPLSKDMIREMWTGPRSLVPERSSARCWAGFLPRNFQEELRH